MLEEIAALRDALGEPAFGEAVAWGRRLPREQAIALALDVAAG